MNKLLLLSLSLSSLASANEQTLLTIDNATGTSLTIKVNAQYQDTTGSFSGSPFEEDFKSELHQPIQNNTMRVVTPKSLRSEFKLPGVSFTSFDLQFKLSSESKSYPCSIRGIQPGSKIEMTRDHETNDYRITVTRSNGHYSLDKYRLILQSPSRWNVAKKFSLLTLKESTIQQIYRHKNQGDNRFSDDTLEDQLPEDLKRRYF